MIARGPRRGPDGDRGRGLEWGAFEGGGTLSILGRILRDRGVISEDQLQEAIQHQVLYGGRLGTSLYELGFLTEERLRDALSRAYGVPAADPSDFQPAALPLVPRSLATRFKVIPWQLRGQTLFLGMVNPGDHEAVARIGYSLGYIVRPLVVPEFRMVRMLHEHFGIDERWRFSDTRLEAEAPPTPPRVSEPTEAAAALDAASTRDEVVAAVLSLGRCYFKRVIFFIVREPWLIGWDGDGEGMSRERAAALRIPLDLPSVFQGVTRHRTVFVGRPGPEETNREFFEAIGKKAGTTAAVLPVAVRGRMVNLIWGDSGARGAARADLGQLVAHMQKIPRAYLRIIRARVAEAREDAASREGQGGRSEERKDA